jgi:hypothetical protein
MPPSGTLEPVGAPVRGVVRVVKCTTVGVSMGQQPPTVTETSEVEHRNPRCICARRCVCDERAAAEAAARKRAEAEATERARKLAEMEAARECDVCPASSALRTDPGWVPGETSRAVAAVGRVAR